jgi:hypothetical protein
MMIRAGASERASAVEQAPYLQEYGAVQYCRREEFR